MMRQRGRNLAGSPATMIGRLVGLARCGCDCRGKLDAIAVLARADLDERQQSGVRVDQRQRRYARMVIVDLS
jgi:hypothetical protein